MHLKTIAAFFCAAVVLMLLSCAGGVDAGKDAPVAVIDEDEVTADELLDEDIAIEEPVAKEWSTKYYDRGDSIAADVTGNIYVAGTLWDYLDGHVDNPMKDEIFLVKWNTEGNNPWAKLWGTTEGDSGQSVAVDTIGHIYVAGYTWGDLDGNTNAGGECMATPSASQPCGDLFLTKWNADGTKAWTKQWGTVKPDYGNSVAVDPAGNIFVTGYVWDGLDGNAYAGADCANSPCADIFLTKWTADGTKMWTKQWGTTKDERGISVATDAEGNIYVTGYTDGGLDGNTNAGNFCGGEDPCPEIFLTKWNADGTKAWTKQWGSDMYAYGESVAVDPGGNIYVAGLAAGDLDGNVNAGTDCYMENVPPGTPCSDIFMTKWTSDGTKEWTKQWGTAQHDYGRSITVDTKGNIYITGETYGDLNGKINDGIGCFMSPCSDIFLAKWNADGTKAWTQQWGTAGDDRGSSVVVDNAGNIHVTGWLNR